MPRGENPRRKRPGGVVRPPFVPSLLDLRSVTVGCLIDGQPSAGAWVMLMLDVKQKNGFAVPAGPANESGVLVVSGEYIHAWAERQLSLALMDYGSPAGVLTGWISVHPLVEVDGFDGAIALFGRDAYPPGFPEEIAAYRRLVHQRRGCEVLMTVLASDPPDLFEVTAYPALTRIS